MGHQAMHWRNAQKRSGETNEEWEERMQKDREDMSKKGQMNSRRQDVRFHMCISEHGLIPVHRNITTGSRLSKS
jgi:hypothetical protein